MPRRRLLKTVKSPDGRRMAKVYRDSDLQDFVVQFFLDGTRLPDGDYTDTDRATAIAVAWAWSRTSSGR